MTTEKEVLLIKSMPDKGRVYTFYTDGTYDRVHSDHSSNLMDRTAIGSMWTIVAGELYFRHADDEIFRLWAGSNNASMVEELTGLLALRNIIET